MAEKLKQKSRGDQGAREIGGDRGGVFHHLEYGQAVVFAEGRLVKCPAFVAQRVVHVDERGAVFVLFRVRQEHEAGKILWDVGSRVDVVVEFLQRQGKREVVSFGADIQPVIF